MTAVASLLCSKVRALADIRDVRSLCDAADRLMHNRDDLRIACFVLGLSADGSVVRRGAVLRHPVGNASSIGTNGQVHSFSTRPALAGIVAHFGRTPTRCVGMSILRGAMYSHAGYEVLRFGLRHSIVDGDEHDLNKSGPVDAQHK